ncbi:MAG: ABC transporter ATP-binding protein [Mycobacterium leprae]
MSRNFVYKDDRLPEKAITWPMVRRLLGFLKPYRRGVILALTATAIGTAARLTNPYLQALAIDKGIRAGSLKLLLLFAALQGVNLLINFFASRYRIKNTTNIGQSVIYDMRAELYRHVQGLSFRFFDQRPAGSIYVRVMNYINSLQDFYTNFVISMVLDSMTVLGIMVVMLLMNWRLALVCFITVPLLFLVSMRLRSKVHATWVGVSYHQSRMNSHLNEAIQGMRVTQAYRQEPENQSFFAQVNGRTRDVWFVATRLGAMFGPMADVTGALGVTLLYIIAANFIMHQQMTVGELVAFAGYQFNFWDPINRISGTYTQMLTMMANAEAIFELFDTDTTVPDQQGARELPPIAGHVQFEDVVFAYEADRPALRGIDLDIPAGETVALVGHTGSGKSTIINLLLRFYDVTGGRVLLDGQDIRGVTAQSLRSQVGVVLQDTFIFAGTVMANIRFGRPDATDEEVIAAAKAARAHEFIMRFPKGYQEEVQERGSRLSMGQRQLISFARALLADPRVLVLDEATANIDTETEREIQLAVERLLQDRTAFVVAHRLSTIRNADRIVVLDHGRIVEMGNHRQLMARRGTYYELVQAQYQEEGAAD